TGRDADGTAEDDHIGDQRRRHGPGRQVEDDSLEEVASGDHRRGEQEPGGETDPEPALEIPASTGSNTAKADLDVRGRERAAIASGQERVRDRECQGRGEVDGGE